MLRLLRPAGDLDSRASLLHRFVQHVRLRWLIMYEREKNKTILVTNLRENERQILEFSRLYCLFDFGMNIAAALQSTCCTATSLLCNSHLLKRKLTFDRFSIKDLLLLSSSLPLNSPALQADF